MKLLPVDDKCSLRGETLKRAVEEDLEKGLIPFYVVATLGTTGTCAFDNLDEIGPICKQHNIWLHIDAAYAGWCIVFRLSPRLIRLFYRRAYTIDMFTSIARDHFPCRKL